MPLTIPPPVRPRVFCDTHVRSGQGGAFILGLAQYKIRGNMEAIFNVNAGDITDALVIYWTCPVSFGTPSFRINESFLPGGMSLAGQYDVTLNGFTEPYQLWVSNQIGLGKTTIRSY